MKQEVKTFFSLEDLEVDDLLYDNAYNKIARVVFVSDSIITKKVPRSVMITRDYIECLQVVLQDVESGKVYIVDFDPKYKNRQEHNKKTRFHYLIKSAREIDYTITSTPYWWENTPWTTPSQPDITYCTTSDECTTGTSDSSTTDSPNSIATSAYAEIIENLNKLME